MERSSRHVSTCGKRDGFGIVLRTFSRRGQRALLADMSWVVMDPGPLEASAGFAGDFLYLQELGLA